MKGKWLVFIASVAVCAVALLSWTAVDELKLFYSSAKNDEMRIDFYGTVHDQHGHPVENVNVVVSIEYARLTRREFIAMKGFDLTTDANGNFVVEGESGLTLFIVSMKKDGYDCHGTRRSYCYARGPGLTVEGDPLPPTKDTPAIFIIRKLGPTTHLLMGENTIELTEAEPEGQAYLCKKSGDSSPPQSMYEKLPSSWPTLKAQVRMGFGKPEKWTLTFSSANEGGKVLLVEGRQYLADSVESYAAEAVMGIGGFDEDDKFNHRCVRRKAFLMVSTEKPKTYSRVELEIEAAAKSNLNETPHCWIRYKSLTNPYGETVLEEDPGLRKVSNVRYSLNEAAWAAFMKEANPEKPDIAKLIADELARRAAEDPEDEE